VGNGAVTLVLADGSTASQPRTMQRLTDLHRTHRNRFSTRIADIPRKYSAGRLYKKANLVGLREGKHRLARMFSIS
jgi:hypothetical protein